MTEPMSELRLREIHNEFAAFERKPADQWTERDSQNVVAYAFFSMPLLRAERGVRTMASNGKGLPLADWHAVEDAAKAFEQAITPHMEALASAMEAKDGDSHSLDGIQVGLRALRELTHFNLAIEREWVEE